MCYKNRTLSLANNTYGLAVISFLAGLAAVLVFRYVSNQDAMRRIKNRIQAHLLEVRLFPDQLGIVSRAYGRILHYTVIYLTYNLKPVAILLLPVVILMVQLDLRFSRIPLRPHDSFILKAKLAEPGGLDSDSLSPTSTLGGMRCCIYNRLRFHSVTMERGRAKILPVS